MIEPINIRLKKLKIIYKTHFDIGVRTENQVREEF